MKRIILLLLNILLLSACNPEASVETVGAPPPMGSPQPAFQSELGMSTTRVITLELVQNIPPNTRVRLSTAQFVDGEWLYTIVVEGTDEYTTARESQLAWAPGEVPGAPTPTMRFSSDTSSVYRFITTETIGNIPPNTRVRVQETRWENNSWVYVIVTQDERHTAEARESQLTTAPTAVENFFYSDIGSGFRFVTTERVGNIAPTTRVAVTEAHMRRNEWLYTINAEDGTQAEAHDWQITYAPDVTPGFIPTMVFQNEFNMGMSRVITRVALGEIPADTPVSLVSSTFDGRQWIYLITDGKTHASARESELAFASGVTPSVGTPTAMYEFEANNGQYNLITVVDIGEIPAGTHVRVSPYYLDAGEWVYMITTIDGLTAEAHQSQLMYASDATLGLTSTPIPTSVFFSELGMGVYRVITLVQVGDIPANTRVRVSTGYFDGVEWVYSIATIDEVYAEARQSQLAYAPNETPGMPTPTMGN